MAPTPSADTSAATPASPPAWGELCDGWLPQSGHSARPGVPTFELYRTDPATAPEAEAATDLYLPVELR